MSDSARARSPVQPGDLVGGKYLVERILGAGGMGVVVSAMHRELGQLVALKFILPDALRGPEAIERFLREARSVARLRSEHVARVFDVGRDQSDNPYMVLELLEGSDLAKMNVQRGPFAVADAVEYILQACMGLVEAHSAGIIHRDLKPGNLFVTRRHNGTPLVKLLDFGIAKATGAAAVGQLALTDSQAVIGSPLYMPPEQMRSARAADVRSDIWSIGVMLYELLGGRLPFDGETVTEICVKVVNDAPTPLIALRPALDPRLCGIVMKCLEKGPEKRWQNVAQLGTALEPYAKSGQQGGMARPWQSFEDTMDSLKGSQPSPIITQPLAQGSIAHAHHAQTDVTLGDIARRASNPPRTSFAKGLAVGIVISIGAVAAAVAVIVPRILPSQSTAAATSTEPSAKPEPPIMAASALPASTTTFSPIPEPSAAPAASTTIKKKKKLTVSPAASASAPAPPVAPAPAPASAPADKPADAPNGAPILR